MSTPLLALALLAACSTTAPRPATTPAAQADTTVLDLAGRRAQVLSWLREYRDAGQFPTDAAGRIASVFVGDNGARCPMAELLHRSGRDDLVARVAADNNAVRLADVHAGPLHDWMLASGLTREEIDMVQGIAQIDYRWMQRLEVPVEPGPQLLAGQAQMRGKLESVEVALRDGTRHGLAEAAARLPRDRTADELAHAPITGAVVPPPATLAEPVTAARWHVPAASARN